MLETAKIGVVTVSDRASRGEYEDLGGPAAYAGRVVGRVPFGEICRRNRLGDLRDHRIDYGIDIRRRQRTGTQFLPAVDPALVKA